MTTSIRNHPADGKGERTCSRRRFLSGGGRAAFSLLEIMVAVTLLTVIIVGLLSMFYQVQRAFRAGMAQVDVMENGRAGMGILTRELPEMVALNQNFTTNFVIVPSESPPLAPDAFTVQDLLSGAVRQNYLRDLCFISRVNDEWIGISYRISNAVSGVGTLYRLIERRTNDSNPEFSELIKSNLSFYISRATPALTPNFRPVLDGVVHFDAHAYDTNGHLFTNATYLVTGGYGFTNNLLPAYVDLELGVLEPSTIAKFRNRDEVNHVQATNFLALQIGRTHLFRQRIPIRAALYPRE